MRLAILGTTFLLASLWVFAVEPPLRLTLFSADPNPYWNGMKDDTGRLLTQKTGITLVEDFAVGEPSAAIKRLVSSGEYPDLIMPKGDSRDLIEAHALVDLAPLIDKYAPNIKRMLGSQLSRLRYGSGDKAIYFIPDYDTVNQRYFDAGGPFLLQLGALKEEGFPSVKTLADYEKVIATFVRAHPVSDGKPTIGLTLLADDWRMLISVTNPAFWATGAPDDGEWYIDPRTFQAKLHYFRPEEREYFRWLNHMNTVGLLDKESFVQSFAQYRDKIASGRVVAVIDQSWEVQDAVNALKAAGKFDKAFAPFPAVLNSRFKAANFQRTGFNAGWGIGITTACKDPVRAIKFLDYLASDEGQVLVNWGIEGVHYHYVNGMRVFFPQVEQKRLTDGAYFTRVYGIGDYTISLRYGDGNKDTGGNYYTTVNPDQIYAQYSDFEKSVLSGYKIRFWRDLFPDENQFPVKPWGAAWTISIPPASALQAFVPKANEIVRRRISEAILSRPSDFDKVYDQMLAELNTAGAARMGAAFTSLIADRMRLWSQ